jgi:dethiobiotin synthetase
MSTYFVTGTGTGIGKTYVTAGLARLFRKAGRPIRVLKPVISGFDPAIYSSRDPDVLLDALGIPATPDAIAAMSPWRFAAPLSPDMAADREGRIVPFKEVVNFCREAATHPGTLLIEGIGGVMVPLDQQHTVLDWMAALGCPALLVTGSYLGTLSHTLTALTALRSAGVPVAAIIVNESTDTIPLEELCTSLAAHCGSVSIHLMRRWAEPETVVGLLD